MQADLQKEENIAKVLQAVAEKIEGSGGIDILVNNAAIFNFEPVDEVTSSGLPFKKRTQTLCLS